VRVKQSRTYGVIRGGGPSGTSTGGKLRSAHRVALWLAYGDQGRGLDCLHAVNCTTSLCCNPEHLRYGSRQENNQDVAECKRRKKAEGGGA
jgi:hypothetical protein